MPLRNDSPMELICFFKPDPASSFYDTCAHVINLTFHYDKPVGFVHQETFILARKGDTVSALFKQYSDNSKTRVV